MTQTGEGYTPMVQQYMEIKKQHEDKLLFYRLGDFYELFFGDAITASRELNLTLTQRAGNTKHPIPMCGVPFHSVDGYLAKLIKKGYRIAICDQMEDPKKAVGIVKREVTKILTPGRAGRPWPCRCIHRGGQLVRSIRPLLGRSSDGSDLPHAAGGASPCPG